MDQSVVLAAGRGTRLRPLTDRNPKALVEVANSPLIEYAFYSVVEVGISEPIIVVGYRGDAIRSKLGNNYGPLKLSSVSEPRQLGVAHALEKASGQLTEPFLCVHGDYIIDFDVSNLLEELDDEVVGSLLVETMSPKKAGDFGV